MVFETDWYLEHATSVRRRLIMAALDGGNPAEIARWEDPSSWYDWSALLAGLAKLRATGEKDLLIDIRRPEKGMVILVDGIYLLHDSVRQALDRVILLEAERGVSAGRGQTRDRHRSEFDYLQWKAKLAEEFDCPYFAYLGCRADVKIAV